VAAPTREFLLRRFSLDAVSIRPLVEPGLENEGYVVQDSEGKEYIARLSRYRPVPALTDEAVYIQRIHDAGCHLVPTLIPNNEGALVTVAEEGPMLLYVFIPGETYPSLTDQQFEVLLRHIPSYVSAAIIAGRNSYENRPHFPSPVDVAHFLSQDLDRSEVRQVVSVIRNLHPLDVDLLIHGDLHSRNFIWQRSTELMGIIDFDDCCRSTGFVEILALIRGTCFVDEALKTERLTALLRCVLNAPSFNLGCSGHSVPDYLTYVCGYFFMAVNRPRPWQQTSATVDDLDLRRAIWVQERRQEINKVLRSSIP
jgi:Ser/Thr protein kinase RdoA (MazF antagonist)